MLVRQRRVGVSHRRRDMFVSDLSIGAAMRCNASRLLVNTATLLHRSEQVILIVDFGILFLRSAGKNLFLSARRKTLFRRSGRSNQTRALHIYIYRIPVVVPEVRIDLNQVVFPVSYLDATERCADWSKFSLTSGVGFLSGH